MGVPGDAPPSLDIRSIRSIKHEEWKKGQLEHAGETKEKHAELWVLAIVGRVYQSCCMEEPQRRIDADSVAALALCVFLETVDNSEVRERALLSDWAQDLWMVRARGGGEEPDYLHPRIQPLPSSHVQRTCPRIGKRLAKLPPPATSSPGNTS